MVWTRPCCVLCAALIAPTRSALSAHLRDTLCPLTRGELVRKTESLLPRSGSGSDHAAVPMIVPRPLDRYAFVPDARVCAVLSCCGCIDACHADVPASHECKLELLVQFAYTASGARHVVRYQPRTRFPEADEAIASTHGFRVFSPSGDVPPSLSATSSVDSDRASDAQDVVRVPAADVDQSAPEMTAKVPISERLSKRQAEPDAPAPPAKVPRHSGSCCRSCQSKYSLSGRACICKVPRYKRTDIVPCRSCGCLGCHPDDDVERPSVEPLQRDLRGLLRERRSVDETADRQREADRKHLSSAT